ncbi:hypothetical protein GTP46_08665 [Duganella sp. FT135W]|uniref:Uncharacterized protein n=1 Tax=Duganella flavida TaxID=2692175 RepID=A0A6L8K828_9BURK|nr:hypothetical protein [Duganella flavida]MYM22717.1 hypothetical protein [Duganella flavida]
MRHDGSQIKDGGICASFGPSKKPQQHIALVAWHQSITNRVVRHHRPIFKPLILIRKIFGTAIAKDRWNRRRRQTKLWE